MDNQELNSKVLGTDGDSDVAVAMAMPMAMPMATSMPE